MPGTGIEAWTDRLRAVLGDPNGPLQRVIVLRETDSTQDAARRLGAGPGDVVVAWRQTAGRGRLGRAWADTGDEGIAVTFVIEAAPPERLAPACAVGAARAAEALLGLAGTEQATVGIKWPNDVVAGGRKLAGVLVEQADGVAAVGIGMNVSQTQWPPDLTDRAVSLVQLGARVDRIDAAASLIGAMNEALRLDDERLRGEFVARDVLAGRRATFRSGGRTITGTVRQIDPMLGLIVRTDRQDEVHLPAATTTVVSD